MKVSELILRGDVSRIVLVHDKVADRKPDEPEYCHWYEVHIEPFQQSMVQTVEVIVTFGQLDEFLTMHGWTYEVDRIQHRYQN